MEVSGLSRQLSMLGAVELQRRIAAGELSSSEVVEAHIARIEEVNGALNAVVVDRFRDARLEARAIDERRARGEPLGRLGGVPITVKESLDVAGLPTTFGISHRRDAIAERDDTYVARARREGAIVLGKTNVAQLLMFIETDNPLYGRTNNPWNVDRSPGGSSGGEGAIIAAGGSPLGLGSDIGGSLRVPAACCGITALKPTAGRTPDEGKLSAPIGQRGIVSQIGVLARETADLTLGLETIGALPEPTRAIDPAELRVAWFADDGIFAACPSAVRAVEEAAAILEAAGARVERWSPPSLSIARDLLYGILAADGGRNFTRSLGPSPRDVRIAKMVRSSSAPRPLLWLLNLLLSISGRKKLLEITKNHGRHDAAHYFELIERQLEYQRAFAAACDQAQIDVLLSPACALPAFRHGASEELVLAGAYTCMYNVLGWPAGVVPVTRVRAGEDRGRARSRDPMDATARQTELESAGLPIGVQVAARPWREDVALAAMRVIEAAARERADFPRLPPQSLQSAL